jgi:anti-anti-sigma factor
LQPREYFDIHAMTDGQSWTLGLAGELDLASAAVLTDQVRRLPMADQQPVVVDLRLLEFVDGAGLRGLLDACALLSERGCSVTVIQPRTQVAYVLRLVEAARAARSVAD